LMVEGLVHLHLLSGVDGDFIAVRSYDGTTPRSRAVMA
jgi:hypothetical protein